MSVFDPVLNAFGWVLARYYDVIPSLGLDIILFTFTIMLILYPLTAKQAKSMIRMQMVQPEIKRIQAKYKHDKAKLNEEMMAFYQENKINPLAGCLPLLVQMPIFFALFRTLKDTYKHVPETSSLFRALCTDGQTGRFYGSVESCGKFLGDAGANHSPDAYKFLGLNLSLSAPNQVGTWATVLAFALVVLVMFTGYMQSRQAQKRTPAANKQMATITKILPVFFGFISLNFPSGLVVYFAVSNAWRLGQQEVIFRKIGTAADPRHKSLQAPAKNRTVDAESHEIEAPDDAGSDRPAKRTGAKEITSAAPAKAAGRTAPRAKAAPAGRTPAGLPVAPPPTTGSGGLKGLFRPPPPSAGPPPPSAAPAAPVRTSRKKAAAKPTKATPSEVTERPGQAGRRTSKKKRKR